MMALVSTAKSQTVTNAAGLSIPLDNNLTSARSAALASAFTAVADNGDALFWNPAGLASLLSGQLSLNYQVWLADTSQDRLLVALPLPGLGGIGISANYVNYGTFAGRDANGTPTSPFSANRIALDAGWGYPLGKDFSLGLALRASQQNLDGNTYTFITSDGGVLFHPSPVFSLGLAFNSLGENGAEGDLPFTVNLGAALRPQVSSDWELLFSGAGSVEQLALTSLKGGAEAVYRGQYAIRAGYQLELADNQLEGLNGLTLGAGYQWGGLSLDYAFLPMGDLGASHLVTLSYYFAAGVSSSNKTSNGNGPAETQKSHPLNPATGGGMAPTSSANPILAGQTQPVTGFPPALPFGGGPGSSLTHHPEDERDGLGGGAQLPADVLQQGKVLEGQRRYMEAIHLYIQAVQNNQKDLLAWWGLGNAYYRLGRKDYAGKCFEQVLRLKPDATGLRDWLDKYEAVPSTPVPAVSTTISEVASPDSATAGEGGDLDIQFKVPPDALKQGKELEAQGKYAEAIGLYAQAIQGDQKNLLAWWGLGNLYYRLGRKDYAVQCFDEVLRIKPEARGLADWLATYRMKASNGPSTQP